MEERGPETPGGERKRRGVNALVWLVVIAAIMGLAAGIAWLLSVTRIEIREVTTSDDVVERHVIEPVRPPVVATAPQIPVTPPVTTGPDGEVVREPIWVRVPQPDFPRLAMSQGVESGAVTLRCAAFASGEMGECEVLAESPAGLGFAEAALLGARQARVKPRSIDGFETDSTIQYTIRFRLTS